MTSLIDLIQHYGLAVVFVNVLLLQIGLPVPAYPALIVTGALASNGGAYSLPGVLGTAVAASLVGNVAWYIAGRRLGGRVLKTLCKVSLSPDSCVRQTETIFARWGASSLTVSRFIPGFNSVATAMAGMLRISLWRFVLFDAIGAAIWSGVAIGLGYLFRDAVGEVLEVFAELGRIGVVLIVAAFGVYLLIKWVQRKLFLRQLRMDRLTVGELRTLLSGGQPTKVLDVRSPISQAVTGRIPGAITVDASDIKIGLLAVEPDTEVVVYCACPNEATAAKVAKALIRHGFKRVRPLTGGIDAWIEAGYEVEPVLHSIEENEERTEIAA
jgi:membrane protein DedA with SNARE-associated domain/rhodanese-related sulfurtransferase